MLQSSKMSLLKSYTYYLIDYMMFKNILSLIKSLNLRLFHLQACYELQANMANASIHCEALLQ